jgi:PilJ/NarX-like methyl-accepting chemotaxis transducer
MGRTGIRGMLAALCLVLLGVCAAAAAEELTASAAINKAGRQRMLSQRIAKSYCQLGLEVMPSASARQLDDSVTLYELQLAELRRFATTKPLRDAVAAMEKAWKPFRTAATGAVSREACGKLARQSDELLKLAQQLTLQLQELAGTPIARLVNISGRQRMLSQKLAKLYMVRAWGFDSPTLRDEMDSARNEFSGALTTLLAAPENGPRLRQELDGVALQWEWFQNALSQDFGYASYRLVVADSSESILTSMETVTRMYEELSANR